MYYSYAMGMNEEIDKLKIHKMKRINYHLQCLLSTTNKEQESMQDYKEIFTDIILDRIKQKHKQENKNS